MSKQKLVLCIVDLVRLFGFHLLALVVAVLFYLLPFALLHKAAQTFVAGRVLIAIDVLAAVILVSLVGRLMRVVWQQLDRLAGWAQGQFAGTEML